MYINKGKTNYSGKKKSAFVYAFLCLVLLLATFPVAAQKAQTVAFRVTGKVTDSSSEPLIGVNVVEKSNPKNGVITDIDGNFSISVSSSNSILVFSYVGFDRKEVSFAAYKQGEPLTVVLSEGSKKLDEVVVVGYGVQKKQSITGAITSVSGTELIKSPVSNVSNAIYGRMSGVTLVQRGGEPGKDQSDIRIRGISTLGSADSSPLIVIDGVERSSMDGIDMNEIESINVLKDASATAVYGIRGANGVIILTTKTGTESKPMVSLSCNVGVQTPTTLPDFLDPYEFALLKNEGMRNDGLIPLFNEDDGTLEKLRDGTDPIFYPSKDFYKSFIKKASIKQQYNVNVSGGTKVVKYFVSLGYLNQQGQYNTSSLKDLNVGYDPNPVYKRYNIRSNFDFNFTKDFTGSIKLGGQIADSNYPNNTTESLFSAILNSPPMIGCGVVDGKLVTGYLDDPLSFMSGRGLSPASVLLNNGYSTQLENTFNINVTLKYRLDMITKGLSVRAMYAYDNFFSRSETRNRTIDTYYAVRDAKTGEVSFPQRTFEGGFETFKESHSVYRIEYFEAALDYQRIFGNRHRVSALLLYNQRKKRMPGLTYSVPQSLQGLVGRATYAYADRYFAEFNLGYNGSENFPEDLRYGVFPAFSLGWVLTEEPFFPKNDYVTFIKLRGSYGEVGNDKIGGSRFLYLPTSYNYGGFVYQFGTEGLDRESYKSAMEGKIGNPYVTWERAKKKNVGVDIRLFDDKLVIGADYFAENRDNILIKRSTVPAIVGATDLPAVNMGKVENKGYEIEAHWRSNISKFNYHIDANLSYARNKIIFQDEPNAAYEWMMATGFSVGQLKGYRNDGFYNYDDEVANRPYYSFYSNKVQKGDLKYIDIDGDGKIDQNDRVPIGYNEFPKVSYGFTLGGDWKDLDFSLLFQGASQTAIQQRVMTAWAFNLGFNNTLAEHMNRWSEERFAAGEKITMPRLSADGKNSPNSEDSDFWVKDASYLRLKNVEIGYTLSVPKLAKIGVKSLRFYVSGNNLLTFTSLKNTDPENPTKNVGAVYPQMKVYNVGLNLRF